MGVNYEQIEKANSQMKATDIKGTPYMEVNQRIKAFRMVYPTGFIINKMLSNENGVCVFISNVGFFDTTTGREIVLGTGHAYEREGSTFINKTSYIENCETSACGRALGMAGFGIDTSVASYEEVATAMANQEERKATPKQIDILLKVYKGEDLTKLLNMNNISRIEDMPMSKASDIIGQLMSKASDTIERQNKKKEKKNV